MALRTLYLFCISLVVLTAQCGSSNAKPGAGPHRLPDTCLVSEYGASGSTYADIKLQTSQLRSVWKERYTAAAVSDRDSVLLDAGQAIHLFLTDSVFPHWYGTGWDFNGYTNEPGEGVIACGYFVSTPLKHCGFNLDRYKVAQQYSHSIVNTLCSEVKTIRGFEAFRESWKQMPDGLYVVGLDNHVGFISKQHTGVWFIHSSYITPVCVVRECAEESAPLASSRAYVIGTLSGNKWGVLKWLMNERITIVP